MVSSVDGSPAPSEQVEAWVKEALAIAANDVGGLTGLTADHISAEAEAPNANMIRQNKVLVQLQLVLLYGVTTC